MLQPDLPFVMRYLEPRPAGRWLTARIRTANVAACADAVLDNLRFSVAQPYARGAVRKPRLLLLLPSDAARSLVIGVVSSCLIAAICQRGIPRL